MFFGASFGSRGTNWVIIVERENSGTAIVSASLSLTLRLSRMAAVTSFVKGLLLHGIHTKINIYINSKYGRMQWTNQAGL